MLSVETTLHASIMVSAPARDAKASSRYFAVLGDYILLGVGMGWIIHWDL